MAISKSDFDGLMGLDGARWVLMGNRVQADDGGCRDARGGGRRATDIRRTQGGPPPGGGPRSNRSDLGARRCRSMEARHKKKKLPRQSAAAVPCKRPRCT